MSEEITYNAGLYLRLSKDDDGRNESVSIGTQRDILTDYCSKNGFAIYDIYIDDGYSGLNFNRPRFQDMLDDIESGHINMVITKDLSRLGRDYIMTGYYTEIFFLSKGIRYIALADDVDTLKGHNEIAPFKNILNDMYAQDISKKVKNAKHHRAKQGLYIGSDAPYGYLRDPIEGKLTLGMLFEIFIPGISIYRPRVCFIDKSILDKLFRLHDDECCSLEQPRPFDLLLLVLP